MGKKQLYTVFFIQMDIDIQKTLDKTSPFKENWNKWKENKNSSISIW